MKGLAIDYSDGITVVDRVFDPSTVKLSMYMKFAAKINELEVAYDLLAALRSSTNPFVLYTNATSPRLIEYRSGVKAAANLYVTPTYVAIEYVNKPYGQIFITRGAKLNAPLRCLSPLAYASTPFAKFHSTIPTEICCVDNVVVSKYNDASVVLKGPNYNYGFLSNGLLIGASGYNHPTTFETFPRTRRGVKTAISTASLRALGLKGPSIEESFVFFTSSARAEAQKFLKNLGLGKDVTSLSFAKVYCKEASDALSKDAKATFIYPGYLATDATFMSTLNGRIDYLLCGSTSSCDAWLDQLEEYVTTLVVPAKAFFQSDASELSGLSERLHATFSKCLIERREAYLRSLKSLLSDVRNHIGVGVGSGEISVSGYETSGNEKDACLVIPDSFRGIELSTNELRRDYLVLSTATKLFTKKDDLNVDLAFRTNEFKTLWTTSDFSRLASDSNRISCSFSVPIGTLVVNALTKDVTLDNAVTALSEVGSLLVCQPQSTKINEDIEVDDEDAEGEFCVSPDIDAQVSQELDAIVQREVCNAVEQTLNNCVKSTLQSTFENTEVILKCTDDSSTPYTSKTIGTMVCGFPASQNEKTPIEADLAFLHTNAFGERIDCSDYLVTTGDNATEIMPTSSTGFGNQCAKVKSRYAVNTARWGLSALDPAKHLKSGFESRPYDRICLHSTRVTIKDATADSLVSEGLEVTLQTNVDICPLTIAHPYVTNLQELSDSMVRVVAKKINENLQKYKNEHLELQSFMFTPVCAVNGHLPIFEAVDERALVFSPTRAGGVFGALAAAVDGPTVYNRVGYLSKETVQKTGYRLVKNDEEGDPYKLETYTYPVEQYTNPVSFATGMRYVLLLKFKFNSFNPAELRGDFSASELAWCINGTPIKRMSNIAKVHEQHLTSATNFAFLAMVRQLVNELRVTIVRDAGGNVSSVSTILDNAEVMAQSGYSVITPDIAKLFTSLSYTTSDVDGTIKLCADDLTNLLADLNLSDEQYASVAYEDFLVIKQAISALISNFISSFAVSSSTVRPWYKDLNAVIKQDPIADPSRAGAFIF